MLRTSRPLIYCRVLKRIMVKWQRCCHLNRLILVIICRLCAIVMRKIGATDFSLIQLSKFVKMNLRVTPYCIKSKRAFMHPRTFNVRMHSGFNISSFIFSSCELNVRSYANEGKCIGDFLN